MCGRPLCRMRWSCLPRRCATKKGTGSRIMCGCGSLRLRELWNAAVTVWICALLPFTKDVKDGAPVMFQEVVHSIKTGEAVCDEQAVTLETEWTTTRMPHGRRSVESVWRGWLSTMARPLV